MKQADSLLSRLSRMRMSEFHNLEDPGEFRMVQPRKPEALGRVKLRVQARKKPVESHPAKLSVVERARAVYSKR